MTTIAEHLSEAERTFAAGIAADREAQPMTKRDARDKRQALIERDGHTDFKGHRCSPCVDCGRVFISSSLRLTRDHARLLCRRCHEESKGVTP